MNQEGFNYLFEGVVNSQHKLDLLKIKELKKLNIIDYSNISLIERALFEGKIAKLKFNIFPMELDFLPCLDKIYEWSSYDNFTKFLQIHNHEYHKQVEY